ncbi:DUF389 domain-containing protein [Actinocorallia sp. A-T 12471]|uniref:DUF389 domain-containing protein n=1 Tax=Actinocorallia sp. A-T 12471 TaxID=3089813 RepID=UPI0029CB0830|nr:DUF389 domain-containing protein [Actinocorallia sp. A-T 12471]MDX6744162.1 DUF389 domain-containing protein [Actinocorallia sp. A-T 12471]
MLAEVRDRLVPRAQRRTLDEVTAELDLRAGDRASRYSAFWTMLLLSATIAAAGVVADSTTTVIGAMIIAPMSTPIMGMALGLVKRARTGAGWFVLGGAAVVVTIGLVTSLVVPGSYQLLDNSQIAGRTSPGLADLLAAVATGLAGAVAIARRDLASVLPGVAVLALGALVLFLSNVFALIVTGAFVFGALGYSGRGRRGRAVAALGGLGVAVAVVLVADTAANYLLASWRNQAKKAATDWLAAEPDASVIGVRTEGRTFHIAVRTPSEPPPVADLLARLDGVVPDGFPVVVETTRGRLIEAGTVGS